MDGLSRPDPPQAGAAVCVRGCSSDRRRAAGNRTWTRPVNSRTGRDRRLCLRLPCSWTTAGRGERPAARIWTRPAVPCGVRRPRRRLDCLPSLTIRRACPRMAEARCRDNAARKQSPPGNPSDTIRFAAPLRFCGLMAAKARSTTFRVRKNASWRTPGTDVLHLCRDSCIAIQGWLVSQIGCDGYHVLRDSTRI